MTEDKMVGWHHQLNGHEFELALGDGEGQESLACCSPWGHRELNRTEQLNNNESKYGFVCSCATQSCLSLRPSGLQPSMLLCPWNFPGKNTGTSCYFLLQGIFPTQVSNPCLLH